MGSNLTIHSPTKPKTQTVRSGFGLAVSNLMYIFDQVLVEFKQKTYRATTLFQYSRPAKVVNFVFELNVHGVIGMRR